MKNFATFGLLALCAVSFSQAVAQKTDATSATIKDLLEKPDTFHKKRVEATGVVVGFEQRTSQKGNKYVVFKLQEGKQFVNVYGQGVLDPAFKDGTRVSVTGEYVKEKTVGGRTYKFEIGINVNEKPVRLITKRG